MIHLSILKGKSGEKRPPGPTCVQVHESQNKIGKPRFSVGRKKEKEGGGVWDLHAGGRERKAPEGRDREGRGGRAGKKKKKGLIWKSLRREGLQHYFRVV